MLLGMAIRTPGSSRPELSVAGGTRSRIPFQIGGWTRWKGAIHLLERYPAVAEKRATARAFDATGEPHAGGTNSSAAHDTTSSADHTIILISLMSHGQ